MVICKKFVHSVHIKMTGAAVTARNYAERYVQNDKGGNTRVSLERLAREARISFWTVNNLWIGRAKTVNADVMAGLRDAYLRLCERQLTALENELAVERAICGDALGDIEIEVARVSAMVRANRKKG